LHPAQAEDRAPAGVRRAIRRAAWLCLALLTASAAAEPDRLTEEDMAKGWRMLFDGRTTDGWRGYQRDTMPEGWQVVDGALTRVAEAGDIITREQFSRFELMLEWQVEPGGNSGVFFHADESQPSIYMTAPEIQVLDDARHRDGGDPLTSAGACYGLYPAPRGVVKPAGEWNQLRLLVDGATVSQWLNGERVARYEIGSADWQQRVQNSKFADWSGFGSLRRGHIGLQDHGDRVAFRNVRIRELDDQ
jgi:hypothetical protein